MVDVDIRILSYLKEELTWTGVKWLRVNNYSTRELKGTKEYSCFKCETVLFVLLCNVF